MLHSHDPIPLSSSSTSPRVICSYYDVKLFLAIFNSLPAQTSSADSMRHYDAPPGNAAAAAAVANTPLPPAANATAHLRSKYSATHISKLKDMGYKETDVLNALEAKGGNLNESAQWLLDHANYHGSNPSSDVASVTSADAAFLDAAEGTSR